MPVFFHPWSNYTFHKTIFGGFRDDSVFQISGCKSRIILSVMYKIETCPRLLKQGHKSTPRQCLPRLKKKDHIILVDGKSHISCHTLKMMPKKKKKKTQRNAVVLLLTRPKNHFDYWGIKWVLIIINITIWQNTSYFHLPNEEKGYLYFHDY